ncbi:hypothetical protein J6590_001957 [Homalodisca vitripennis]|nr:hypothetical protein J6590_001957 [Homalodisca vitripennis]
MFHSVTCEVISKCVDSSSEEAVRRNVTREYALGGATSSHHEVFDIPLTGFCTKREKGGHNSCLVDKVSHPPLRMSDRDKPSVTKDAVKDW